jgi:hypothetical protein
VTESLEDPQGVEVEAEDRTAPAEHQNALSAGLSDGGVLGQLPAGNRAQSREWSTENGHRGGANPVLQHPVGGEPLGSAAM